MIVADEWIARLVMVGAQHMTRCARLRGMRTLGIDLASSPLRTAVCVLEWRPGGAAVQVLEVGDDLLDALVASFLGGPWRLG